MNLTHAKFKCRLYISCLKFLILNPVLFLLTKPEPFIEELYIKLLGRPADTGPGGKASYLNSLASSKTTLYWKFKAFVSFCSSAEYQSRISRSVYKTDPNEAHHYARMKWFKTLPAADTILDLGGSCSYDQDGALLAMGYPHHSKSVTIIDFPPAARQASSFSQLKEADHVAKNGARVKFVYDSFVNLEPYESQAYDMVFAGQVIEHVTEDEAKKVLRESFRVLKKGGWLCLDTPNRRITQLISSNLIHPEHKIEYQPDHLIQLAKEAGFIIEKKGAISPMPLSLAKNKFLSHEICDNIATTLRPEEGFSFFLELRKQ